MKLDPIISLKFYSHFYGCFQIRSYHLKLNYYNFIFIDSFQEIFLKTNKFLLEIAYFYRYFVIFLKII